MLLQDILLEAKQVFYHGSNTKIDKFDFKFISPDGNRQLEGPGVYFTTDKSDAMTYGKYLHQVEIDFKPSELIPTTKKFNTADIATLIKESPVGEESLYDYWGENLNKALRDATSAIFQSYGPDQYFDMVTQVWADFFQGENEAWINAMLKRGYVGHMVNRANGTKHFICYDLSKISSIKIIES